MKKPKCHPERPYCCKGLCVNCYYFTPEQRQRKSDYAYTKSVKLKIEVLSYYGKKGRHQCCWEECKIKDIDMLTLDHIDNSGGKHRAASGRRLSGTALYRWAKNNNYPDNFQTLCGGHQLKKAIIKANEERGTSVCHFVLKNKTHGHIPMRVWRPSVGRPK